MRGYQLDPHQPVGGVIAEDADQQIVQLNLQKGNEAPPYSAEAIITITVLSGGSGTVLRASARRLSSRMTHDATE